MPDSGMSDLIRVRDRQYIEAQKEIAALKQRIAFLELEKDVDTWQFWLERPEISVLRVSGRRIFTANQAGRISFALPAYDAVCAEAKPLPRLGFAHNHVVITKGNHVKNNTYR